MLAGDDPTAENSLLHGRRQRRFAHQSRTVSLLSDFSVQPIFEDTTVYVLDSKLDARRRQFRIFGYVPAPATTFFDPDTGDCRLSTCI